MESAGTFEHTKKIHVFKKPGVIYSKRKTQWYILRPYDKFSMGKVQLLYLLIANVLFTW